MLPRKICRSCYLGRNLPLLDSLSILEECYFKNGEKNRMITFVKRSELPAPVRGKAGSLSVIVTRNGQIQLSGMCQEFIGGDKLVMGFDAGTVYLVRTDSKLAQKVDPKNYISLRLPKKGKTSSFSAGALLNAAKEWGASHVYPYKASGNQTFAVTKLEKEGALSFSLPATALTPKPVVKRTPKPEVAVATAATANAEEVELVEA
jgi:hypothetical protein